MDCAFEFGPHPKKSRNSDVHLGKCWLCDKYFEQKQDVGHPDPGKIQVLFGSIRAANDNENLLAKVNAQEDDIVAGKISVKYHHNCRSSYLLKRPHAYLSEQNVRPKRSSFKYNVQRNKTYRRAQFHLAASAVGRAHGTVETIIIWLTLRSDSCALVSRGTMLSEVG